MAHLFLTERGCRKLVYNGFGYVEHKKLVCGIRWKCEKKDSRKCNAYAKSGVGVSEGDDVEELGEHTHSGDAAKVEIISAKNSLKRKAGESIASTSAVVSDTVGSVCISSAVSLPLIASMGRAVRRYRAAKYAPMPKSASDLIIPDNFWKTLDGDEFLFVDDHLADGGRLIMFFTEKNVDILGNCGFWYAVGTFSVAPNIFTQLYTIHGLVGGETIPLVYALLTDKTEASYSRVFQEVRPRNVVGMEYAPDVVVTDFEKAAMNAVSSVYAMEQPIVHGCYFHLCQSLYRRVGKMGLAGVYASNRKFKLVVRMIAALSFVPLHCVVDYYLKLEDFLRRSGESEAAASALPILTYFGKNYVGVEFNGKRISPKFAPKIWNNVLITKEGGPRTNNGVEGWHRRFQSKISCDHPNIWKLFNAIQEEQQYTERRYAMITAGRGTVCNAAASAVDERLIQVISMFSTLPFADYLKGIVAVFHANDAS